MGVVVSGAVGAVLQRRSSFSNRSLRLSKLAGDITSLGVLSLANGALPSSSPSSALNGALPSSSPSSALKRIHITAIASRSPYLCVATNEGRILFYKVHVAAVQPPAAVEVSAAAASAATPSSSSLTSAYAEPIHPCLGTPPDPHSVDPRPGADPALDLGPPPYPPQPTEEPHVITTLLAQALCASTSAGGARLPNVESLGPQAGVHVECIGNQIVIR